MTGDNFLALLEQKLRFATKSDRDKILGFYHEKLSAAGTPDEEAALVEGFGPPDEIAKSIHEKYAEMNTEATRVGSGIGVGAETRVSPGSVKNTFSQESFASRSFTTSSVSHSGTKKRMAVRYPKSSEQSIPVNKLWLPETDGLFVIILRKLNASKQVRPLIFALLLILLAPLLIIITVLAFALYAASIGFILAVALCLILIMLGPTAIAIAGLSYGIIMLFQNITIALIEIGIGTMVFSIVIAIVGIGYQLVAGLIPAIIGKLSALYKYGLQILKAYFFGTSSITKAAIK